MDNGKKGADGEIVMGGGRGGIQHGAILYHRGVYV